MSYLAKIGLMALVFVLGAYGLAVAQPEGATPESMGEPDDWLSPDMLAAAVYSVVSGPAGEPRDWSRYRALFRDDARFITFGGTDDKPKVHAFGVEDYIKCGTGLSLKSAESTKRKSGAGLRGTADWHNAGAPANIGGKGLAVPQPDGA